MGTAQLIIVLCALMALVAFVAIGIDWIGRPLRNRRFIPRLYRFDDEKLPVDDYGHTTFGPTTPPSVTGPAPVQYVQPVPHVQPAPVVVADIAAGRPIAGGELCVSPDATTGEGARPEPDTESPSAARSPHIANTHSAFSDTVASPDPDQSLKSPEWSNASVTQTSQSQSASRHWEPGMALSAPDGDSKPNLATKSRRFWQNTELCTSNDSHFDAANRERMSAGTAPVRINPRTGRSETMQLSGLRRAAVPSQVRMLWPDDSVDPWSTQ